MALFIRPPHYHSFEPVPCINDSGVESYDTVDVYGGYWGEVYFDAVSNIGSSTDKYIIADLDTGTIYATATKPDVNDNRKRLLITLIYELFNRDSNEYPETPEYEGEQVIKNWIRHQVGDIYEGDFKHMFKTEAVSGTGKFKVRPGIWTRNERVNASSHKNTFEFDPINGAPNCPAILPAYYTGYLHVYNVLLDSSGGDGIASQLNLANDSTFYDCNNDGTNGLIIWSSVEKLEAGFASEYFSQFLRIADIHYTDGEIDEVIPAWVGSYQDANSNLANDYYNQQTPFNLICQYFITYDNLDFDIYVIGGQWRARNISLAVDTISVSRSDLTTKQNIFIEAANSNADPSLVPDTATIKADTSWPDLYTYTFYFRKLYQVHINTITCNASGGEPSVVYSLDAIRYHMGGDIQHDWVRPDGQDCGNYDVDDSVPKGRTLNFIAGGLHEGEVQDFEFKEKVINNGLGVFGYDNDQVIPFYPLDTSDVTEKTYARIDAINAETHADSGKSLEVDSLIFQLYDFFLASGFVDISDYTDFGTDNTDLTVLLRDVSGAVPTLKYGSFYNFKPQEAYYADEAGTVAVVPTHDHEIHNFNFDDHATEGVDRYIINDGDAARNNMSGVIGDGDGYISIEPTDRYLRNSIEDPTVMWESRLLMGNNGAGNPETVDWGNCYLNDNTPYPSSLSVDWHSRKAFQEDGVSEIFGWDGGAISIDATAASTWNFDDALNMTVGAESTWNFDDPLNMTVGAESTWAFGANLNIYPDIDGENALNLGMERLWNYVRAMASTAVELEVPTIGFVNIRSGGMILAARDTGLTLELGTAHNPTFGYEPWDSIEYNGVAGVDLENWTTKGGFTGATVTEKMASDLQPGDKVLCIPA